MSLLLHLSDLHLAPPDQDADVGDYKKLEILSHEERQKKVQLIRSTLRELARFLTESGEELDGVVITGDVTIGNSPGGFKLLDSVMAELGRFRPTNTKVVVVPGNHDVAWQGSPFDQQKDEDRYANFLTYVRKAGYVTPLLDGIDFEGARPTRTLVPNEHLLLHENRRWVIIPVNSSHFCGRAQHLDADAKGIWGDFAARLGITVEELGKQLSSTPTYDIARIQPEQLELIGALALAELGDSARRVEPGTDTLRIAVLHHHLQPPTREEFKPFESLTNLAHFREFLRTHQIDIVLHGHKHSGCLYWDYIFRCSDDLEGDAHPVFVVAAPAPEGVGQPMFRLLRFDDQKQAPTVSIASVPAVSPGTRTEQLTWTTVPLWRPNFSNPADSIYRVHGHDFDTTYARLKVLFRNKTPSDYLYNVICRTETPLNETRPPFGYPIEPESYSLDEWFLEMVEWWQQETSRLEEEGYFTHGSRIKRFGPEDVNQLDFATKVLQNSAASTRAVITLLIPSHVPPRQGTFPSFCQLHLVIRNDGDGHPALEAIAYFRKQEMKYWWPINMAEVMKLQKAVFEKLNHPGLRLGAITTISPVALWSDTPPRVVIPKVDRLLDQDPHVLWELATSLYWHEMPGRSELLAIWNEVFDGLVPPDQWNEDGVPIATGGLEYLIEAIGHLASRQPSRREALVRDLLSNVLEANRLYRTVPTDSPWNAHAKWRDRVRPLVDRLRQEVSNAWDAHT